jgi:kynureninase
MKKYAKDTAIEMDMSDPLGSYRSEFSITDSEMIYLDGNSLGRLPLNVSNDLKDAVDVAWGERLIRSWNEDWYTKNLRLGNKIALVAGALPGEVIVTDSTSVNLYKLAFGALKRQSGRTKIITDDLNFPSDLYILEGLIHDFGTDYELIVLHSEDGITIRSDQLEDVIDERTALVSLSHVVFKSSFRYPMQEITAIAHRKGALVLWDLSHSIGAVPGELKLSDADLAVGCTYKYLNGGPGSPAFLYVRKDLQDQLESPIWGWFGDKNPFDFNLKYRPAEGINRFLAGTPPVLSMVPMERTLDMLIEAGMDKIRYKSVTLTDYLLSLAEFFLYPLGFTSGSPIDASMRGSHISLRHPEAYRICRAMIDPKTANFEIIPDFREPDNIRLGIAPLYTRFIDIYNAVKDMELIVKDKLYENFSNKRESVT